MLFLKKKYALKFYKSIVEYNARRAFDASWKEIQDGSLLSTLMDLQKQYNFKIVRVKLNNSSKQSCIVIQCEKGIHQQVFSEFCAIYSKFIEKCEF